MMRALREAAAAHARNAEMAHAHAIVNPKLARRDIEKLLKDHERELSPSERASRLLSSKGGGGNKRNRRLKSANGELPDGPFIPKPPPKGRRKGGRKAGGDKPSEMLDGPSLQPMPRFAGAGPVANGSLLRPSHAGVVQSFTGVGTF